MRKTSARRTALGFLSSALTFALTFSSLGPVSAAPGALAPLTQVADKSSYDASPRVPFVESTAGIGNQLSTDPSAQIAVPGIPEEYNSALVRVSVFDVLEPITVFAAGAPALSLASGSGSTAILLPVADGKISLYGTTAASLRVELVASFDGKAEIPGSTIAIETPITRANTADGLADSSLDKNETFVGLTGQGGVPATGVRAVYVTATVSVPTGTTLHVDGQEIAIPEGNSSISTVVSPSADGTVPLSISSGEGSLRVDVRGWVPEAPQNAAASNVVGSFVPLSDATTTSIKASDNATQKPKLTVSTDSQYVLALVSAPATKDLTTIRFGNAVRRSQGAVVNPHIGAQAQLVVLDTTDMDVSVTRGQTTVSLLPVGVILATDAAKGTAPTLSLGGPSNNARIDLTETGTFEVWGKVSSPNSTIESVKIDSSSQVVGSAELSYAEAETSWTFTTSVPEAGEHTLTVTATDRAGRTTSQKLTITAVLPEADDIVISDDAVIIESGGDIDPVLAIDDISVTFKQEPQFQPGDIIVSENTENAPEGFLRRVASIDLTENGWLVNTIPAALTEAITQADINSEVDPLLLGAPDVDENVIPGEEDTIDVNVIDEGEPDIIFLEGEDVDIDPLPEEGKPILIEEISDGDTDLVFADSTPQVQDSAVVQRPAANDLLSSTPFASINPELKYSTKASTCVRWEVGTQRANDCSKAKQTTKESEKDKAKANGGIILSASGEFSLKVKFVLDIEADWSWGNVNVTVNEFELSTKAQAKVAAEIEAYLQVTMDKSFRRSVAKLDFPALKFMAGVIPIIINPKLDVGTQAMVKVDASVKTEFSGTGTLIAGFRYTAKKNWEILNEVKFSYKTPVFGRYGNASFSGGVKGTFGPELSPSVKLYDVAGPQFKMPLSFGAEAKVVQVAEGGGGESKVEASIFAESQIEGKVDFKIPIIEKTLFSMEFQTKKLRITFKKWEWPFDTAFPEISLPPDPGPGPGSDPKPEPSPDPDPDPEPSDVHIASVNIKNEDVMLDTAGGFSTGSNVYTLTDDGALYTWGSNTRGQLGVGTTDKRYSPTVVPLPPVSSLFFGGPQDTSVYALTTDGELYAWGDNTDGQLGDGTTENRYSPTLVPIPSVESIFVAESYFGNRWTSSVYALTTAGALFTWGANPYGQLGNGTTDGISHPVLIELPPVRSITPGAAVYALTADGELYTWGATKVRPVESGTTVPVLIPLPPVAEIKFCYRGTYIRTVDGSVYAWGECFEGLQDDGVPADPSIPTLTPLPPVVSITSVASGYLALTSDGSLYSWGSNSEGQLGDSSEMDPETGTFPDRSTPVRIALPPIASLTTSGPFADTVYALTRDGRIYVWGANYRGELEARDDWEDRSTPYLAPLPPIASVSSHNHGEGLEVYLYALTTDGALYSWGRDPVQRSGGTWNKTTPTLVAIPPLDSYGVFGESEQSYAVTKEGDLYVWGRNWSGSLGDGTHIDRPLPVRLPLSQVASVTFSEYNGFSPFVLTKEGDLYNWGKNDLGQLGHGTIKEVSRPTKVEFPPN